MNDFTRFWKNNYVCFSPSVNFLWIWFYFDTNRFWNIFIFAHEKLMNRFASVNFPNICIRTQRRRRRRWLWEQMLQNNFSSNLFHNNVHFISLGQSTCPVKLTPAHTHIDRSMVEVGKHQRNWISPKNNRTKTRKINNSSKFTNICWPIKFTWMDAMMRNGKITWKRKVQNLTWIVCSVVSAISTDVCGALYANGWPMTVDGVSTHGKCNGKLMRAKNLHSTHGWKLAAKMEACECMGERRETTRGRAVPCLCGCECSRAPFVYFKSSLRCCVVIFFTPKIEFQL